MAKLTLDQLRRLREESKKQYFGKKGAAERIEVIIGMGSCGIAAGAKKTWDVFEKAMKDAGIENGLIKQTGCMGMCSVEPTVEIHVPGMPDIIYGNVDEEFASRIVRKHIQGRLLLNDHILDKPAADFLGGKEA